jgi:glucans biosynthesis protein C
MTRLHSLDALRAAMMLLGLLLHSAVSYITVPLGAPWPYQDAQTSALFDWVVFIIHLFRMPTFFVMAGFFAAYLYYREGPSGFLRHRARRVLLPLVLAWLIVFPPIRAGFVFANAGGGGAGLDRAMAVLTGTPYLNASLGHLWFLSFLFIFCLAACAVAPLVERLPAALRTRVVEGFAALAPRVTGCLVFALLSAATLLPMSKAALDTSTTFVPSFRVLVAYAVFFGFGWLLFLRQEVVAALARRPWPLLAAGLVASAVYVVVLKGKPLGGPWPNHIAGVVIGGLAMWLLIYGVTGLFVRYFERSRPVQRYLADASYWMYLVHLPLVIWLQGALASWPASPALKFAIVLSGVTVITVATYHYFVRATPIGVFLSGRRFERALPRPAAVAVPAPAQT